MKMFGDEKTYKPFSAYFLRNPGEPDPLSLLYEYIISDDTIFAKIIFPYTLEEFHLLKESTDKC